MNAITYHTDEDTSYPMAAHSQGQERRIGDKATIGLVLSSVPGYSETFFRSKIQGLQAQGFEVVLFVDYPYGSSDTLPCKTFVATAFNGSLKAKVIGGIRSVLSMLVLNPKRSLKLFKLDRAEGKPMVQALKHVFLNQHLLSESLDWLHFGFGMLAKDREHIAQAIGAKMGVSFRGYDLYLSPLKHPDCYQYLFKKQVRYHVLAEEMKATLTQKYQVPSQAIYVIPPAIDIDFFKIGYQHPTQEVWQLTTVARLHWKKGLSYTLEALALLKQQGKAFHYTIIGDGDDMERLVFAVHQLGLTDVVTFKGRQSQLAVKAQLEQTDLYVQYSVQEGFCNAVLEAQAMGLLCIVSNAEGLSENVLDGKTGWVVPKRQPELLASKIVEVMQLSESLKADIRQNAMNRVRETFHLEQQRAAFLKFFTE